MHGVCGFDDGDALEHVARVVSDERLHQLDVVDDGGRAALDLRQRRRHNELPDGPLLLEGLLFMTGFTQSARWWCGTRQKEVRDAVHSAPKQIDFWTDGSCNQTQQQQES